MAQSSRERPPAIALVGAGAISVQFGAAVATKLFHRIGPAGAVTLRLVVAAVVLVGVAVARRSHSPARIRSRQDLAVAILFGLDLAAMNLCFYESIDRIPLGIAVTIEFAGPLLLALSASRRWADGLWAVLAGAGVALLATGSGRGLDPVGLLFAGLAGAGWVAYILLNKSTGRRFDALSGLTIAMVTGAVVLIPFGVVAGGASLFHPEVLALGLCVGVLSSVVPYSLELIALRRVTPRAFGVMMSLDPALATAAGWIVIGQSLTGREWVALALVVAANAGNALVGRAQVEVEMVAP